MTEEIKDYDVLCFCKRCGLMTYEDILLQQRLKQCMRCGNPYDVSKGGEWTHKFIKKR